MRRMTLVAAVVALLAGAAMLLVATVVAADDNDGDGDEDEVRLVYVDEWLDGTLVNCEPASISYGYELDGEVCDVEDGPWSDELETLLGDLDRDKDRERVADLVYELLVANAECDGLNSVDHVRGMIVDPWAEKKCLRSTVVTETDALSCAGQVVVALGEGSASERRGRLHDMLFMPEENERPACGQPRVTGTPPSPPTTPTTTTTEPPPTTTTTEPPPTTTTTEPPPTTTTTEPPPTTTLVPGTASISGTVTTDDVSAVPISDVTVTLYTEAGSYVDETTTAADGTYTFGTVGSGDYDLEFTATGYDTEWFDNAASAAAGSLTVGSAQAKIANAALLSLAPGSISGTITDDSGPVSGVTVEAYVGGAVIGSTTSATDGTYKISGLVGDTYTVLANTGPAANPDTHFSAWHVFAPLFLTDDATDVVVGLGDEVTGINIALQPLFVDVVVGSGFYADIVWMQESGITLGCGNDAYCASDSVTRAEMATFLVRALELAPDATNYFSDDNGNIHEANINALRGAGVTLGCNAEGTLFCPSDTVTRAQMASFLVRALGYPISGEDYFTDDNGNTHEDNINTLRANNVTLGCNPDLYCPNDSVRRDHMAAFIHRALG